MLDIGQTRIAIPKPGENVTMNRLFADGSDETVVSVDQDGTLDYSYTTEEAEELAPEPHDGNAGDLEDATDIEAIVPGTETTSVSNTCGTNFEYKLLDRKLYATKTYFLGDGSIPGAGTFTQWQNAAAAAASTWVNENSPCFSADGSSVPALNYGGYTTIESNIVTSGGKSSCGTRDSYSVFDAGNLDLNSQGRVPLATACVYGVAHTGKLSIPSFDIKFNTSDFDFTYDPTSSSCSNKYDVISILTHEIGHGVGMADIYTSTSKYQTMHGSGAPCRYYPRTLHDGDVRGVRAVY